MCHCAKLYTECNHITPHLILENTISMFMLKTVCNLFSKIGHYEGLVAYFVILFLSLFLSFPNVGKSSFMNKVSFF